MKSVSILLLLAPLLAYPAPVAKQARAAAEARGGRIINYDGELKAGLTYRAKVRGDKVFDLVLIPPLKIPSHQSVGVDWTNLEEFPALKRLSRDAGEREIVFKVISDKVKYMGGRRWSKMLVCKIVAVE